MLAIRNYNLILFLIVLWAEKGINGVETEKNIKICDYIMNRNAPVMYTEYIKALYQQGFSITPVIMPNNCNEFNTANDVLKVGVGLSVPILGILDLAGVNTLEIDIDGRKAKCNSIKDNIENSKNGVSLEVKWPITYLIQTLFNTNGIPEEFYTQYTQQILTLKYNTDTGAQLHNFITKSDKTTVWFSVTLDSPNYYDNDPEPYCQYDFRGSVSFGRKKCIHPFFRLSNQLFNKPLTFSSSGIEGTSGYINFDKKLYSGANKKLIQARDSDGKLKWGILMAGCAPPTFVVQMVWETNDDLHCNRPKITVTNIRESEEFICRMDFTVNGLRTQALKFQETEVHSRIENGLMQKVFTMKGNDVSKIIVISSSHAKTITDCIFTEQKTATKWDGWSISAPGKCVACSSSSSGTYITRIPRACNLSVPVESDKDCCFDCKKGYNLLTYYDASTRIAAEHCVKACANGYVYDNERSEGAKCIQCEAGKYTKTGSGGMGGGCMTCAQLDKPNSIVVNTKVGCVFCGNRAKASPDGTKCLPCGDKEYVPKNTAYCTACPRGSRLISAESQTCTQCSPGYEYTTDGKCVLCNINSYKANSGSGTCTLCPNATRALSNRTMCVPCNNLNKTIAQYAIYRPNAASSCEVMCNLSVSYAYNTNPYTSDGCRPCTEKPPPIGWYSTQEDCSVFLRCTNAPINNLSIIEYTGSGSKGICPWDCKVGYTKSSTNSYCVPCNSAGFNASLHVYVSGCSLACIPKLYYRDAGMSCTQKCTNMLEETNPLKIISRRLGEYYSYNPSTGSKILYKSVWPHYIMGQCGSDEKDPTSPLALLKYVGIYGLYSNTTSVSSGSLCGNYILNTGEECDDGNTANSDGCSNACQIEKTDFWDCDIIGEPCKKKCGWSEIAVDSWEVGLIGFVFNLPKNKNIPWCTGILYQDFLDKVPLVSRGEWMLQNLVSCDCENNPMQTLPYSECNYTNGGCRECAQGTYMDDLYMRCSPCGSACAPGFRTFNRSKDILVTDANALVRSRYGFPTDTLDQCGPRISTSKNITFADPVDNPILFGREQILIGCMPCSLDYGLTTDKVFVKGDIDGTCNWICKRDPANQTDPDYYCQNSNGSLCNGNCLPCDTRLQNVKNSISSLKGKYITPCIDVSGHDIGNCNTLNTIPNAQYTGNSVEVVGDSAGCPWKCNSGYQRFSDTCMFCNRTRPVCKNKGEMVVACNESQGYYCASCVLTKGIAGLKEMEIWQSLPDFSDCVPGCEDGVSFRNTSSILLEECQRCTHPECNLDELHVPCTVTQDSVCTPCTSTTADELIATSREFYSGGTCRTRCIRGYASNHDNNPCILCSSMSCRAGQYLEHKCNSPMERWGLPNCIMCDIDGPFNINTAGRKWDIETGERDCSTSCLNGWMFQDKTNNNLTCVPCQNTICEEGFGANCMRGEVVCYPCPFPIETLSLKHMKYGGRGNCTTVCESSEYYSPSPVEMYCELIQRVNIDTKDPTLIPTESLNIEYGIDLLSINDGNNTLEPGRRTYPMRNLPHSAYTKT